MKGIDKHPSLLRCGKNYCCKMFFSTSPWISHVYYCRAWSL